MNNYKTGVLVILIFSIVFPILLLSLSPETRDFDSEYIKLHLIGQLVGVTGLTLFAINLLLATRFKFLDKVFFGLNRVYIAHHIVGGITLILILFHPLVLAAAYATFGIEAAAEFVRPSISLPHNLGTAAMFLMLSLLIVTFFIKLPYKLWKATHQFLGISFILASAHALTIPGSIIQLNPFMKYFVLFIATVGTFSYLYRTVLSLLLVKREEYAIQNIKKLSTDVLEITLKPLREGIKHQYPGQFAFIKFRDKKVGMEEHPFTISSAPDEKSLRFTIKTLGDHTAKFENLATGTKAWVEGPYGKFSYLVGESDKQIWIAGGIGITPFLSMLRNLTTSAEQKEEIDLYYCVNEPSQAVGLDEIGKAARGIKDFELNLHSSKLKGRLTAKLINEKHEDLKERDIFICGPLAMMVEMKKSLISLGVSPNKIYTEEFNLFDNAKGLKTIVGVAIVTSFLITGMIMQAGF